MEFVFQKFLFSGVCLVRSLSRQEFVLSEVCLSGVCLFRSLSFRSLSFRSLSWRPNILSNDHATSSSSATKLQGYIKEPDILSSRIITTGSIEFSLVLHFSARDLCMLYNKWIFIFVNFYNNSRFLFLSRNAALIYFL